MLFLQAKGLAAVTEKENASNTNVPFSPAIKHQGKPPSGQYVERVCRHPAEIRIGQPLLFRARQWQKRGLRRYDIEGRSGSRSKRVPRKETEPKGVKGLSKQAMVVTMSENLSVAEIAGMQTKSSGRTDSTALPNRDTCSEACGATRGRGASDKRRPAVGHHHRQGHCVPLCRERPRCGRHAGVCRDDSQPTVRVQAALPFSV